MSIKPCYDHLGNKYNSVKEMCRAYGIDYRTYKNRIDYGWTLKDALTKDAYKCKICYDHLGNKYNSVKEMCRAYGIDYSTYKKRIDHGWALKDALTSNLVAKGGHCFDHLGNEYNSKSDMCGYYGINYMTFKLRIKCGWDLEQALTCKSGYKECSILGYKFKTAVDACKHFESNKITFGGRIRTGYDVEVCILTTGNRLTLKFIGLNNKAYYSLGTEPTLYTARQLIEKYRPDLLEAYDKSNPTGEYNPYRGDMEE